VVDIEQNHSVTASANDDIIQNFRSPPGVCNGAVEKDKMKTANGSVELARLHDPPEGVVEYADFLSRHKDRWACPEALARKSRPRNGAS
jgi:hypothetical protein